MRPTSQIKPTTAPCTYERGLDPAGKSIICGRPGYVEINGKAYCKDCFHIIQNQKAVA